MGLLKVKDEETAVQEPSLAEKIGDIVNVLYFSYGVGSPCRTVCTVCGSPPCMKNKSH